VATRAGQVLTQRALNRALLARQLLLERGDLELPRALDQVGGLQAQYAPSMYVGLWTRLRDFPRDELTRALEKRTVVQGTLLRSTIHLVSTEDYWPFTLAIRSARRQWWLRVGRQVADEATVAAAAGRLRRRLADVPVRRTELDQVVGKDLTIAVGLWVDLVRVPPSGTWERRRADLFGAAEDWVGPEPALSVEDAVDLLVRRYLGGFGPANRRDIADWAGLPVATIAQSLDRLELRRFRDENGGELVDLPGAPLPDPDTPAPVRFLPHWDATLLVHARRALILPEEYRPRIFHTKMPQSIGTFLVDGSVAGTWRYADGRVQVEPFEPLPRHVQRDLDKETEALGAFHS
jgi:hypothetical protein